MEETRSVSMDFSVSIPAASAMETTTMVPRKSPSFRVVPLPVLHDEMSKQLPGHPILGAKRAAVLLLKKVLLLYPRNARVLCSMH